MCVRKRIRNTSGTVEQHCAMMASVPYGRRLYGEECHYITEEQVKTMRRVMCTAMGDTEGRRPDGVRQLVYGSSKWGPRLFGPSTS